MIKCYKHMCSKGVLQVFTLILGALVTHLPPSLVALQMCSARLSAAYYRICTGT